jgi:hypothetical protein
MSVIFGPTGTPPPPPPVPPSSHCASLSCGYEASVEHYLAPEVDSPEDPVDKLDIGPIRGEKEAAVRMGLGDDLLVLQQGLGVGGRPRGHQGLSCNVDNIPF